MADYDRMSDAEVYERVATALNIFPVYDDTPPQVADFARRRVLDAMVADPECRWWPVIERIRVAHRGRDEWRVSFQAGEVHRHCIDESLDRCICIAALMALEAEGE